MASRSRGLPSAGCNKCRSRKIRCDEARPICGKCTKLGLTECIYRDEFERSWRHKTRADEIVKSQQVLAQPEMTGLSSENHSPPCPILSRFFYDWAVEAQMPGISISWFDSLPTLYTFANPDGVLHKAIEALANANFAKRCSQPDFLEVAANLYGESLVLLRQTLALDSDVSPRDVLASVILLGIYEAFVDKSISHNGTWLSHMSGASMILKRQQQLQEASPSSLDLQISRMIFRQMLHGSLISGRRPAIPEQQGQSSQVRTPKPIAEHTKLTHRAALLSHQWNQAFADLDTTSGLERLAEIASLAMSLDGELARWAENLPPTFQYNAEPITDVSGPDWLRTLFIGAGAPRNSHVYATPVAEYLWRFHWEARLILCQALLYTNATLINKNSASNPIAAHQAHIESCLLSIIDQMCGSCLTPIMAANRRTPQGLQISDIPSLHGYLLLQILPTVGLCLEQTVISNPADLTGRKEWVWKMKEFVNLRMGFSKAAAQLETGRLTDPNIQVWGMAADSLV